MFKPTPIIYGPKLSGKTLLARKLAGIDGLYDEIDMRQVLSLFAQNAVVNSQAVTLIVGGVDRSPEHLAAMDALTLSDTVELKRTGRPTRTIKRPQYIFVMVSGLVPIITRDSRRFKYIETSHV